MIGFPGIPGVNNVFVNGKIVSIGLLTPMGVFAIGSRVNSNNFSFDLSLETQMLCFCICMWYFPTHMLLFATEMLHFSAEMLCLSAEMLCVSRKSCLCHANVAFVRRLEAKSRAGTGPVLGPCAYTYIYLYTHNK